MIEELIGEEIVDETDQYVDVHRRIAVARARLANVRHTASAPVGGKGKAKKERPEMMTVRSLSQPDTNRSINSSESLQDSRRVSKVLSGRVIRQGHM